MEVFQYVENFDEILFLYNDVIYGIEVWISDGIWQGIWFFLDVSLGMESLLGLLVVEFFGRMYFGVSLFGDL